MTDNKPIRLDLKMQVWKNPHGIAPGSFIDIIIEVIDNYEIIKTSNVKLTKDIIKLLPAGAEATFSQRLQKAIVFYPGKTQKEILKIVEEDLKNLPVKRK